MAPRPRALLRCQPPSIGRQHITGPDECQHGNDGSGQHGAHRRGHARSHPAARTGMGKPQRQRQAPSDRQARQRKIRRQGGIGRRLRRSEPGHQQGRAKRHQGNQQSCAPSLSPCTSTGDRAATNKRQRTGRHGRIGQQERERQDKQGEKRQQGRLLSTWQPPGEGNGDEAA